MENSEWGGLGASRTARAGQKGPKPLHFLMSPPATPTPKERGPGSLPPARETIDAVAIALGTATAKKKGKVSRIKKSKKDTFMLSCKEHLMDLYARLD